MSGFTVNTRLLYAGITYLCVVIFMCGVAVVKDLRDKDTFMKEAETFWLVHPIYSVMCGPYSSFFPRL